MNLRTIFVTAMVSVALSVGALTAPSAAATPRPTPPGAARNSTAPPPPHHWDGPRLSKTQKKYLAFAKAMVKYAIDGKTFDYRKADAHDGGHSTYRRKFAMGWEAMPGHKIIHISSGELRTVRALRPPSWAPVVRERQCTGRSDFSYEVAKNGDVVTTTTYLNSCETDKMILFLGLGAAGVAIVAAVTEGGLVAFAIVAGAFMTIGAVVLDYRQRRSTLDATYVKTYGNAGITIKSQ